MAKVLSCILMLTKVNVNIINVIEHVEINFYYLMLTKAKNLVNIVWSTVIFHYNKSFCDEKISFGFMSVVQLYVNT